MFRWRGSCRDSTATATPSLGHVGRTASTDDTPSVVRQLKNRPGRQKDQPSEDEPPVSLPAPAAFFVEFPATAAGGAAAIAVSVAGVAAPPVAFSRHYFASLFSGLPFPAAAGVSAFPSAAARIACPIVAGSACLASCRPKLEQSAAPPPEGREHVRARSQAAELIHFPAADCQRDWRGCSAHRLR